MSDRVIEHVSLKGWFAEIFDNRHKDPIEHLLVLTYEFNDQQLVNLVSGKGLEEDYQIRLSQLKIIARLRPIVVYDSQKTREFNSLPHFIELYPVHNNGFSCHHPKAYLLVTSKSIRLIIGSCNLTHTGMFKNREVYKDFVWNETASNEIDILHSFVELVEKGYADALGTEGASAISLLRGNIRGKINEWFKNDGVAANYHALLASGYSIYPTGLEQLKTLWKDRKIRKLFVVSPFFDKGEHTCLAHEICKEIGTPEELCIITDEKNVSAIAKQHFSDDISNKVLRLIPTEISEAERARIQKSNNNQAVKDLALERSLHAKILILVSDKEGLVYQGSANFSCKAWKGQNKELGIVNWENDPEKLIAEICKGLGVGNENVYKRLPEKLTDDLEDKENPEPDNAFPSFIKRIVLCSKTDITGEKVVWFEISAENMTALKNYDTFWGRNALHFKEGISETIPQKKYFADLIGNRNIRFVLKSDPKKFYYLPVIYSDSIQSEKEVIVYPDSNDWLDYYLGLQEESFLQPGESLPGESDVVSKQERYDTLDVDRESNIVISMQHYLDKFSRIEKNFMIMAEEISQLTKADRDKRLSEQVIKPLEVLAKILDRERILSSEDPSFLFKLGELVLLARKINLIIPQTSPLIGTLLLYIPSDWYRGNEAYKLYRKFIGTGKVTETHANV